MSYRKIKLETLLAASLLFIALLLLLLVILVAVSGGAGSGSVEFDPMCWVVLKTICP